MEYGIIRKQEKMMSRLSTSVTGTQNAGTSACLVLLHNQSFYSLSHRLITVPKIRLRGWVLCISTKSFVAACK